MMEGRHDDGRGNKKEMEAVEHVVIPVAYRPNGEGHKKGHKNERLTEITQYIGHEEGTQERTVQA